MVQLLKYIKGEGALDESTTISQLCMYVLLALQRLQLQVTARHSVLFEKNYFVGMYYVKYSAPDAFNAIQTADSLY